LETEYKEYYYNDYYGWNAVYKGIYKDFDTNTYDDFYDSYTDSIHYWFDPSFTEDMYYETYASWKSYYYTAYYNDYNQYYFDDVSEDYVEADPFVAQFEVNEEQIDMEEDQYDESYEFGDDLYFEYDLGDD